MPSQNVPYSALNISGQPHGTASTAAAHRFLFGSTPATYRQQIENHVEGRTFLGAVVRKVEPYTLKDGAALFQAMAGGENAEYVDVTIGRGVISLKDPTVTFALRRNIFDSAGKHKFYGLVGLLISYRTLVSAFSSPSGVEVTLKDAGMDKGETVPRVEFNKTLNANILLGLNYSVPAEALSDLAFSVGTTNTGVGRGRPWATMEVVLRVVVSDKPFPRGMTRSGVQYVLPSDLFEVQNNDPRLFNAVLSPDDLRALKDIADDIPGAKGVATTRGILASRANGHGDQLGAPSVMPEDSASNVGALVRRPEAAVHFGAPPPLSEASPGDDGSSLASLAAPLEDPVVLEAALDMLRLRGFTIDRPPVRQTPVRPGSFLSGPAGSVLSSGASRTITRRRSVTPIFGFPALFLGTGLTPPTAIMHLDDCPELDELLAAVPPDRIYWYRLYSDDGLGMVVSTHSFEGAKTTTLPSLVELGANYPVFPGSGDPGPEARALLAFVPRPVSSPSHASA